MQPTNEEQNESSMTPTNSTMMKRSQTTQNWLVVGHETTNEAANIGRCVDDGILLQVHASIAGRPLMALTDSGVFRCYMDPATIAHYDLKLENENLYLELVDGSKILSTQKVSDVYCQVGKSIYMVNFIVTKLLYNANLVLRIN